MTVAIGTVDLNNVLNWDEDEETTIPKKRIVRKTTPTSQAAYFVRMPRQIVVTARMTSVEKAAIRSLKNQGCWQPLYDYDSSFVDYIWIEKISPSWKGDEDATYPWLITITMTCSST